MALQFDDLRVLKAAEELADDIWQLVIGWDSFAKDVVGKQLARAADSIGANIAEAFGRYHYGEKLQFLYYARGSLFETKYWINRGVRRRLLDSQREEQFASSLNNLGRQLNQFAQMIRQQRNSGSSASVAESSSIYLINPSIHQLSVEDESILSQDDLNALSSTRS
jgi:four helix bundle protein